MYLDYPDKCSLSIKENIFQAKKIIVENIYNGARLEGCNVTFPETETILNGVNVPGVSIDDIECILNLRNAWRLMFRTIEKPLTLDYVCKIHGEVSRNEALEWGGLRTGRVGISGTAYVPPIPIKKKAEDELGRILGLSTVTSQAIYFFLWATRSQLFWDGNKRNSMLIANKILIPAGRGVFTVKEKDLLEFNRRLSAYYHEGDFSLLDDFLYHNCIICY